MINPVRRIGIAIGSFVAAGLIVWLVGGLILPALVGGAMLVLPPLFPISRLIAGLATPGTAPSAIVTFFLGWLIFRDIVRRDRPRTPPAIARS